MKIAVSSCGIFLDSPVGPRFGRCDYFLFVDTTDMSFEAVENENANLSQEAGVQSAELSASKGAQVVITGNIGPNAISALSAAGIVVALCRKESVKNAIKKYQNGLLKIVNSANVRDHYGMVGESARQRMKAPERDEKEKTERKKDFH